MKYTEKWALEEARGRARCEVCLRLCDRLEAHHVVAKGHGGGKTLNLPMNLLGVHRHPCHEGIQGREEEGCRLVGMRTGLDAAFVRERLWQLLRAPRGCQPCPSCWGEGSVKYYLFMKGGTFRRLECLCCGGTGILTREGAPFIEPTRRPTWA